MTDRMKVYTKILKTLKQDLKMSHQGYVVTLAHRSQVKELLVLSIAMVRFLVQLGVNKAQVKLSKLCLEKST